MSEKPRQKRVRLGSDKDVLKKLVAILSKEKVTKQELAGRLNLDAKKLTDSVFLAAVKLQGESSFLANLAEKTGGRAKKGASFKGNRGLLIPAWMFVGKNPEDGQEYIVEFGRKGLIHLRPKTEEA